MTLSGVSEGCCVEGLRVQPHRRPKEEATVRKGSSRVRKPENAHENVGFSTEPEQTPRLHRCRGFAWVSRYLRPARTTFANRSALKIMLRDPLWYIVWLARHHVTTVPTSDLDMDDPRRKQLVSHRAR